MLQKTLSLILAGLMITTFARCQNTNFSFTNKPLSDPELPNYGRGAQYWNGTPWDNNQAPQIPEGTSQSGAKTLYRRWWWTECESAQGVYTFTKASQPPGEFWKSIEASLEYCANNGQLLGYGSIMASYDSQEGVYFDGGWAVYPKYLHDLMQAETNTKDWYYSGTGNWVPNWNSPSYLARWRALQQAAYDYIMNYTIVPSSGPWAGKTVRGRDILDWADVRGYGNFGEWHTWPWTDATPTNAKLTDSSYVKIVDATKDIFKNVPLHINVAVFDANSWGDHNAFRAWYALTKRNDWGLMGYRDDGIGDFGKWFLSTNPWTYGNWRADTALLNRWKYSPNTGEPLNGTSTCCPLYYDIRNQLLNVSHYATFGNGNYGSNSQQTFDTIRTVFKLAGFRYNLNGGYMSTTLAQNANFNVSLNWRNVGNAPIYQKRWRVVYQLKTAADVEVKKWTSKFNPFLFLPKASDSIVTEAFNVGNVPLGNTYKLTIKFEDSVGLLAPLFIAINSPTRNSDGSYTLRSNISVLSGPLPVTFNSFDAKKKGNGIELTWNTNCTTNNQKYEVERSYDGATFDLISIINAENNCLTYTYKYTDWTFKSMPVYYRIRQMDMDGKETYSKIVKVGSGTKTAMAIYPNPVTSELTVVLDNEQLGRTYVLVNSVDGKLVKQYQLLKTSEYFMEVLNMKELQTGVYFVKIVTNGTNIGIKKLVKN